MNMSERSFLVVLAVLLVYKAIFLHAQLPADALKKALISAVRQNNIFLVEQLLEHNLLTSLFCQEGDTVLHKAVVGNQPEVVRLLLENTSVDSNARNAAGETPLHTAILWGHTSVVQVLLEHAGLDMLARCSPDKWTALEYTARFGKTEILKLLLSHMKSIDKCHCDSARALAQSFGHGHAAAILTNFTTHAQLQVQKPEYLTEFKIIEDYIKNK